jgi:hypothetical protein
LVKPGESFYFVPDISVGFVDYKSKKLEPEKSSGKVLIESVENSDKEAIRLEIEKNRLVINEKKKKVKPGLAYGATTDGSVCAATFGSSIVVKHRLKKDDLKKPTSPSGFLKRRSDEYEKKSSVNG